MKIKARDNELTAVIHRENFESYPGGIDDYDKPRWRKFRELYNKAQKLEVFTDFPLQIDFELNSTCQLKCKFCTHGQTKVEKRILPFELFQKAIDEGSKYGLCSIKLNYINEPLLNRDLIRYIEYARSKGVLNIYFATNGLLLDREMSRKLIEAKVSKIMVSIDAVTRETYHKMRGYDKLDTVITNILGLLEIRSNLGIDYPLVRVNFLQTKENIDEADAFVEFWEGIADFIGFQQQVQLPGIDSDLLENGSKQNRDEFKCSFPFKLVTIDSSGAILPCCTFSGRLMPLGNIETMSIYEAWNNKPMIELKELHQASGYKANPICLHCVGNHK